MGNWSSLSIDLLAEIARRIECFEDFIIFFAVCSAWRSISVDMRKNYKNSKPTKVPWLILSKKEEDEEEDMSREFFNLSKGKIYNINLLRGQGNSSISSSASSYLDININNETKFCFASQGWFLINEKATQLSILNPFSLRKIYLPRNTILKGDVYSSTRKRKGDVYYSFNSDQVISFALSCFPISSSEDFIAMVIIGRYNHRFNVSANTLAFCKHGDPGWTSVDFSSTYTDISYYDGRFYAFQCRYHPLEIDIQQDAVSTRVKLFEGPYTLFDMIVVPDNRVALSDTKYWLAGYSPGVLMKVTWDWYYFLNGQLAVGNYSDRFFNKCDLHDQSFQFGVEELNLVTGECKQVKNFGNKALFLGQGSSFFVDVSNDSTFKSNHIYFLENCLGKNWKNNRGVSVYSMIDGTSKPFFNMADYGRNTSVLWIEPEFESYYSELFYQ